MYNCFKELSTDIVFNVLYIYIFFILFYIMYNIHVVKRFRAHCGFYAIENKLLLLLLLQPQTARQVPVSWRQGVAVITDRQQQATPSMERAIRYHTKSGRE